MRLDKREYLRKKANELAFNRMTGFEPRLAAISSAVQVIPGMDNNVLLHSGPSALLGERPQPIQAALIGAIIYEGWADTYKEASLLLDSGKLLVDCCHNHSAVGPMAGVISPSMPVFVVTGESEGREITAYITLNEGLGKVLRYGGLGDEVIARLKWIETVLAPALNQVLSIGGPIGLKPIIASSLRRGDECHNRNASASSTFFKEIAPCLVETSLERSEIKSVMEFIKANDHFFLNLSMGAAKVMAEAAHGIEYSSIVTAMASNGIDFGIKISGGGDKWFTAQAPMVDAKYLPGYSEKDANPVLGDSPITETVGYGAFALAAAPAILSYIGGTMEFALDVLERMKIICQNTHPDFLIPYLGYSGTPTGIDVFKVVENGIEPVMDVGVAHKEAGKGQVGAGLAYAPMECFTKACRYLSEVD